MNQFVKVEGAVIRISDLAKRPYETITIDENYDVVETMAEGYVPNLQLDRKVDAFLPQLQRFVDKHKASMPDRAQLLAAFVRGANMSRNPKKK